MRNVHRNRHKALLQAGTDGDGEDRAGQCGGWEGGERLYLSSAIAAMIVTTTVTSVCITMGIDYDENHFNIVSLTC